MKYLTQAEFAALAGNTAALATAEDLLAAARALVARAGELGLVLTVEQRPLLPLAMGHYETVVSVREARR